jgi:acyl transferase domain-containing protein/NAD(P)-dependent dehydrogenase (short-subunit alcohol dehydrogenase family)/acyl carrier protein
MKDTGYRAIAIVGTGAIMPDAPNVPAFWNNIKAGRYSISEVAPDRWDSALYYDADHNAPDKTYSKIGGWVREYEWEPLKWRMAIPPRVADAMDEAQRWGIACTREALADYGYPERPLNTDRTAVILGNAMAGERHYMTAMRAHFPEYARELDESATFAALPDAVRRDIRREWRTRIGDRLPPITEDSMPGELANVLAGRIANVYNFHGPNFVCDAACASTMAAVHAAADGLIAHDFDVAVTGGIDRNMGASTFVKFCKIGALSATGSRPYAEGADGFVMGEGAALFLMKRLADAERDGDKIYAVLRGIGGSSDGKGKGITAPNPIGQKICIERAWENAGLSPATVTLIEGHGTSTSVGDVVEAESMAGVLREQGANGHPIALGSVKSNLGHLKGAAGAAGILKITLALRDKVLPPSVRCEHPNPNIDFAHSPLYVNTELRPWTETVDGVRRAGVSAFGFGGTNFHTVLEEYIPHRLTGNGRHSVAVGEAPPASGAGLQPANKGLEQALAGGSACPTKAPLRGALLTGAASEAELAERLRAIQKTAEAGRTPAIEAPADADLRAAERVAIDYANAAELADKCAKAVKALASNQPAVWKALRAQGIFRGHGPAPKVAFLYTGQGSQYVNMLRSLRAAEPIVANVFEEADRVMTPILGKPLSQYIFVDKADNGAVAQAEEDLRQTAITQPAVLATDLALTRLFEAYGIRPDMTMGHSLGEYGALVAAGALPFADALEAVAARGREMTRVSWEDNGRMAAVFAPLLEIERILKTIDGYVVLANINSDKQAVIGGASPAVELAIEAFAKAGYNVVPLPVSHAFHTSIVAPASAPLRQVLERLRLQPGCLPVVTNVNGEFYPADANARSRMLDILTQQIASPVQFVKGLRTLYDAGARVFVEVGPKKALHGFVEDVLGDRSDVLALFTNHPKLEDAAAFNQALCGLYAAGLGTARVETQVEADPQTMERRPLARPIVITGASLGIPGTERIFDDSNVARILRGEQFIDTIPTRFRRAMLDKHITRLVKSDNGGPTFEQIQNPGDVIKLAARGGAFDLCREFGVPEERIAALDRVTSLAIAAGIDALRDAGIPLTMRYKSTTTGTQLPERWGLPDALRDDTGVIFASVFPGYDSFADEMARYYADHARREQLATLEDLRERMAGPNGQPVRQEIDRRIAELQEAIAREPFQFDRRFLFRVLSMGHSQFAELIGARGPNTQINAACASTTQAIAVAEDWIRAGRCRRVIIVSADDITSDHLIEWFGAGFLASGAAATDDVVEEAAVPFDRRRHGMIMGMGAAALVLESAEAADERGLRPICELLSAVTANSAFHGTRLDVHHIQNVMEDLVKQAETRSGIQREQCAAKMVFVSHETYTPARGGSAAAEIHALRAVFGEAADRIVIANTKGFTGHAMGTGIEDVVAVKALETGCAPPVANFKEIDPELGPLNLSKGGAYPLEYALRLGAGFGSQISMTLLRRVACAGARPSPNALGYSYRIADPMAWQNWLDRIAGHAADLEIVHRTLRVRDTGAPAKSEPVKQATRSLTLGAPIATPTVREGLPPVVADPVQERILALVVEKTGYPTDMLDLDLDLEADLGVDTVKQAEMFAAIRETYNIPRDPNLKLRDFPTLARVIQFVYDRRPDLKAPSPIPPAATPPVEAPPAEDAVRQTVLNLIAEKTGYPKDMLDLDLDLEADLGIDTVKQAEVFAAIRETYNIPRDPNLKLRDFPTLARVIQFVYDRRPDLKAATPAPAAVPQPAPVEAPPTLPTGDPIRDRVLEIVAEKTGYPKDMLDLDLDLEADLGIDTVKQAEMFASVRAAFNIPRDQTMRLRDFPTLAHVIRFAEERRAGDTVPRRETATFEAAETIPRRVPVPALRPPLSLCKPTGISLGPGRRVLVTPDRSGVAEALTARLQALGVEVVHTAAAPIHGVYWLPALDDEGTLSTMTLDAWREAVDIRLKSLYRTMRTLYDQVAPPGTFLISATRLGGQHGYDEAGATAPLGGSVTGFTKAYKRERPDALVKAVDFETGRSAAEIAELLINETLRDSGAIEIGYQREQRWTVGLEERPAADGQPGMTLDKDSVFLVTGAAGSIVSAITADLAAASGGTFYLLDLVPEPDPANPDLKRFAVDKDGLKRDLFARIQARGERATPALVEKELAALERAKAASDAIDAVRAAGGIAHYYSVNLTDGDAVASAVADVRRQSGRIDVLLHAAGIDRSHSLPDKDTREFDLVVDVKCDGLFHLLHAIGDMPLGVIVGFSSIAGRFGNGGQTDYSAANDLICKIASNFRRTRPATRAIAIDWTAWGGIGMATRGSIPKVMEMAGIDMLPPEAGVPWIRRELTTGGGCGEVVVAGRLGALLKEWDATGGLDASAVPPGPMLGEPARMDLDGGLTVQTILDPTVQPFLDDHRIDGTPVLPGVMGIEGFAETALCIAPGWQAEAVEDIEFLAPFKFYRGEPRPVTIEAHFHSEGEGLVADCRLTGRRTLAGQSEARVETHFTGRVRLAKQLLEPAAGPAPGATQGPAIDASDIYRIYFHGPAYRVLKRAWWHESGAVGEMASGLPDNHHPSDQPLAIAPRLIELCFQTAGIFEMAVQHRMGLPRHVDRVELYRAPDADAGPLFAVVTARPEAGTFDADVVDSAGTRYLHVAGYRTVVFREDLDSRMFPSAQAVMA